MNKIKLFLMGIIYFPVALIISLTIGVLGGVFFKILASFEDMQDLIRTEIKYWKIYPQKAYDLYIADLLRYKKSDWIDPNMAGKEFRRKYKKQPFPLANIVMYILGMLVLMPFRCISGMFKAPVIVFMDFVYFWQEKILKIDPLLKYGKYLKKWKL